MAFRFWAFRRFVFKRRRGARTGRRGGPAVEDPQRAHEERRRAQKSVQVKPSSSNISRSSGG